MALASGDVEISNKHHWHSSAYAQLRWLEVCRGYTIHILVRATAASIEIRVHRHLVRAAIGCQHVRRDIVQYCFVEVVDSIVPAG